MTAARTAILTDLSKAALPPDHKVLFLLEYSLSQENLSKANHTQARRILLSESLANLQSCIKVVRVAGPADLMILS